MSDKFDPFAGIVKEHCAAFPTFWERVRRWIITRSLQGRNFLLDAQEPLGIDSSPERLMAMHFFDAGLWRTDLFRAGRTQKREMVLLKNFRFHWRNAASQATPG
jgi:hypothetical protein